MKKFLLYFALLLLLLSGIAAFLFYKISLEKNTRTPAGADVFIKIPTGADVTTLLDTIQHRALVKHPSTLKWAARYYHLETALHPGRYRIKNGMSNRELIRLIMSGEQEPLTLQLPVVRNIGQIARRAGNTLECDSSSIMQELLSSGIMDTLGLNKQTLISMFIPDSYEFYWNTTAKEFIDRQKKEYRHFWNTERLKLASGLKMSPVQITILASIVEQETAVKEERSTIAGVYLNRLNKKWKLDADPTLIFALNDFTIRRVLNAHKEIRSPYNTYLNEGLPPGPICNPSASSIDAVLNYTRHNYMFFCAKEDFSGSHNFAATYAQHMQNARKFQKELNKRNIK